MTQAEAIAWAAALPPRKEWARTIHQQAAKIRELNQVIADLQLELDRVCGLAREGLVAGYEAGKVVGRAS